MRRAISWILVAATLLGFVGMIAFSVLAESYVKRVFITTPQFQAGDAITTEFALEITNGTLVENHGWFDDNMQPASGTFVANEIYCLRLELAAPEGYAYSEMDTVVFPNGYGSYTISVSADEKTMLLDIEFNFHPTQVQRISVENMPEQIQAGPATVPEGMSVLGLATITAACWVDKNKESVAALEDGKAYFLEVTFAPEEGCEFRNWMDVYGRGGLAYSSTIVSENEAKAWFAYSLEPGVGNIELTVTGLEVGKPISGVQVTLAEDAKVTVRSILVWDNKANEQVKSGNFEADMYYGLTYVLEPKEGYNIEDYEVVFVQSEVNSWSHHVWNGLLQVNQEFSANKRGDLDADGTVDEDDALYLLRYVLMPQLFPVDQPVDFDCDGCVDEDDAIYLLQHALLPDLFPLL